VINDGHLTLGDGSKMKLDTDPFPVGMVELMDKKILVRMDQAEMTKGKNVDISDEPRNRMIKPRNPKIGVWKENMLRKPAKRVKPTSAMLIENINGSWRRTGGAGLPEGSNGIDSSKLRTCRISGDHGVQGSPRGGWCNTLQIRNPR
jgi:hypothetical protein